MVFIVRTIKKYRNFKEFWPFYVGEHSRRLTRTLHFAGTLLVIVLVVLALFISAWLLALVPVAGYGFAWGSHFYIEKNRPATFTYPVWSLIADFRMFGLMLAGKMDREVGRCQRLIS